MDAWVQITVIHMPTANGERDRNSTQQRPAADGGKGVQIEILFVILVGPRDEYGKTDIGRRRGPASPAPTTSRDGRDGAQMGGEGEGAHLAGALGPEAFELVLQGALLGLQNLERRLLPGPTAVDGLGGWLRGVGRS